MPFNSIEVLMVIGLTLAVIAVGLAWMIWADVEPGQDPPNADPDNVSSDTPEEADWHTRGAYHQPWDHF